MNLPNNPGENPGASITRTCIIYDTNTGQIQHVHSITTHSKAKLLSEEYIEKEAYELASQYEQDLSKTKALHITGPLQSFIQYEVNVKDQSLIEKKK